MYVCINVYLERELVGCFLLKMADNQVVSARSSWYVDKGTLRKEFNQHIFSEPNSTELRIKLSSNGAFNVSKLNKRYLFCYQMCKVYCIYIYSCLVCINQTWCVHVSVQTTHTYVYI